VWKGIPFYTILLLAGLKAIPREQYEAAEVDGASVVQRFRYITLPGLRYVILITLLLSFISTFNTFGLIVLLTSDTSTRLFSILAYERAIQSLRFGPGAAAALSMAPFIAVVIFVLSRVMRPEQHVDTRERKFILDRISDRIGRGFALVLDLFFLPVERLFEAVGRATNKLIPRRSSMDRARRERAGVPLRIVLLLPPLIFVLFPLYWIFITSFKTDLQIQTYTSIYWPSPWTLDQHRTLLLNTPFLIWFRNTFIVAAVTTPISVVIAALAAYALTRLRFLGGRMLTTLILVTYLLPGSLLFIPLYRILTGLGIINTHLALFLTYPTFLMPFSTWVLMGYFRSIPVELEEAALIDGADRITTFWRITLPLAAPALLSVTIFAFTNAWNEFLFAYVFINSDELKTLPVGLQLLKVTDINPWGLFMSASLLMAIPVVVVYIYAQRYLVEGLTAGGLKG